MSRVTDRKEEEEERKGFFSVSLFERVKKYLRTAKKDDPPVIGTTENFCEPDPERKIEIGMIVSDIKSTEISLSMEEALAGHAPGAADLVNKLIEEESHDE